uniref:Uncharacterized protein n=1 Tax=Picea sitchensis TaxID=3332 RepID=A0A6B9XSW6_PICSI|nr:hypothetical protein Q903MT_gene4141 [Picea sitchensis]
MIMTFLPQIPNGDTARTLYRIVTYLPSHTYQPCYSRVGGSLSSTLLPPETYNVFTQMLPSMLLLRKMLHRSRDGSLLTRNERLIQGMRD